MRSGHEIAGTVRVVVVSPSDVASERELAQAVVDELNGGVAADRGCHLSLWRWETDTRPGLHLEGPQGMIDERMKIQNADVVVGVFWKRLGTPTADARSGTEHELRRAWAAWDERRRPDVMVYFCTRPYTPDVAELSQLQRLLKFREQLPPEQIWWGYESERQFEALLRVHLTDFLLAREPAEARGAERAVHARVRFNLPPVAASFTGRDAELDAIHEALGVGDPAVVTQTISGLGGVGKSQLAARYVHRWVDAFDIVAWIRAEDGGTADLANLAVKLGVAVDGLSPSDRARGALDSLTATSDPWLLVLDNVASAQSLEKLLPATGSGRVLVTSRDRGLREFGPVLAVDVFDEDTATAFLVNHAGRPREERAARELAGALGCLPLALSHAAAFCRTGTSFDEYLERLGQILPVRDLFRKHPEASYARTVASTWKTSIEVAADDAPLAADVLEMAAYLGPDAIPRSLFDVLGDGSPIERHRRSEAFNALDQFSLATVDDKSMSVHRLLQKTIRDDAAARGEPGAALRTLTALCGAFPADVTMPAHWPLCERLLPHVLAFADALPAEEDAVQRLLGLLDRVCEYLHRAEPGKRGLELTRRAASHAERLVGADTPAALGARNHLAIAAREAGFVVEAIEIFEPLLDDCERILGSEHRLTLSTRHNLAYGYQEAARNSDAVARYEPLLADRERILGAEDRDTLASRHGLAYAYLAGERNDDAIAICEPLLRDRERLQGAEHPDTLSTRHNLARAHRQAGHHDAAIAMFEPLLDDRRRILGPEHAHTMNTRHNLACAYLAAGRTGDAIAMFEPLLADRERILGSDHHHTVNTRRHLEEACRAGAQAPE